MYIFDDREHLRTKRKERARRRRTCRPWIWNPARIYNIVKRQFGRFRRRLFVRELPETEYDRYWANALNFLDAKKSFLCFLTVWGSLVVGIVLTFLVLFLIGVIGVAFELYAMALSAIAKALLVQLERMSDPTLSYEEWANEVFDDWFNRIHGFYIQWNGWRAESLIKQHNK